MSDRDSESQPEEESPVAETPVVAALSAAESELEPVGAGSMGEAAARAESEGMSDPADAPEADVAVEPQPEPPKDDDEGFPPLPTADPAKQVWYVLKVQSNREDSIAASIRKRLKIAGVDDYVGEIVVPTEKVSEIKDGKKRIVERKFFPGYIMMHVELTNDVWLTIRETPGVGDFVGSGGKPVPMSEQDVAKMLGREAAQVTATPRLKIDFQKADRVKIKEGTFENFEGEVDEVVEAKGLVRVMIQIFGRPTPVELEYWQVERV